MKKYLLMILAAVSMVFSSVALTSCGDDDDESLYPIEFYVTQGTMPQTLYSDLQTEVAKANVANKFPNQAQALIAFNLAVNKYDSNMKKAIQLAKEEGYTGVYITCTLKDHKGKMIKSYKWS